MSNDNIPMKPIASTRSASAFLLGNVQSQQATLVPESDNINNNIEYQGLSAASTPSQFYGNGINSNYYSVNSDDFINDKQGQEKSNEQDIILTSLNSPEEETTEEKKHFLDEDDPIDYPEGGLKAYLVILGCFFGLIPTFGILNTMGVIETYIQQRQLVELNSSTIGWIFSLFSFVNFSTCIFSGTYFDRRGCRALLIGGALLHFAGLFGLASSTKLWMFIVSFSLVCGAANGMLMSPLVSVPSHYFKKKRGQFTAIATTGGSIGGIVFPILLRKMFQLTSTSDEFYGFKWGIRTLAFLNIFLLTCSVLLVTERFHDESDKEKSFLQIYVLNAFDFKAFKNYNYLFCVIGTLFGEMCITCSLTYYGAYCTAVGISDSNAYLLIMLVNIMGIPGRWIPGYISDLYGRFNVAILTLLMLTLITLVAWLPFGGDGLRVMYGVSILYGFTSGSIFSLLPVCCGQISKTEEFVVPLLDQIKRIMAIKTSLFGLAF
ncbi:related to Riboflavin transporter MCH5 [Saccharomycodes ludwigii]|uniref:Related to Riboflavin transporter MCH5 n=1 Tax=Saccharomycodes ludwigii TaxID=36035 RepID=A0A376BBZ4_9ASCO|nr:related to Riboflavin transporter MCH5 [Saccharomycodes ludwigii]